MLALIRQKAEVSLNLVVESTSDEKLQALCGKSRHIASSKNYFIDSTYYHVTPLEPLNTEEKIVKLPLIKTSSKPLVINAEGKVINVLPLEHKMGGKKSWSCNISCKIDDPLLINRYQKFLEIVNTCTLKNVPKLIQNIHECTMKISNKKLGHIHVAVILI